MMGRGGIAWYWPDLGGGYRDGVRGLGSGEICEVSPFAEGTDAVVKEGGVSAMFSRSI
jgi:hypothetical protein